MPLRVAIKPEVGIEPIGLRYSLWIAMKKRSEDNDASVGGNRRAADGSHLCRLAQDEWCRGPQAHRIEKHGAVPGFLEHVPTQIVRAA